MLGHNSLLTTDGATSSGTITSRTSISTTISRSDSTRSMTSSTLNPVDRDYTKDNVASPIDMESRIQAERITKILDETIYKTKLALCLPLLVQEYQTLHKVLSPQHEEELLVIFGQYGMPVQSSSLVSMHAMEDIISGNLTLRNRLNPELANVIYIMNSYPDLKPKVTAMVNMMKAEYITGKCQAQPALEYLSVLEQFTELMMQQMNAAAADELLAKMNTKKLEVSNARLNKQIEKLSQRLKQEHEQFDLAMAKKRDMVAKLQHEVTAFQTESNIKLKKKVLDSERQMVLATRNHAVKVEMLREEFAERKEAYNKVLKEHLQEETNQRLRRCKVEAQILSWMQKYDIEMGEKQTELDGITEQYEDELNRIKELEEKLQEQDKEYIPLMAEREAEYQQEMMEKMNKFREDHAARVIQSAWRQILENRAEKKKLKKQVNQVMMEAEREMRRQEALQAQSRKARKGRTKLKVEVDLDDDDIPEESPDITVI